MKKNSIVYGNPAVGISKPEHMNLAEIIAEMIAIAVKNPRVVDELGYKKETIPGQRYHVLQQELIRKEEKYLKFEKLLTSYTRTKK